jgi:hypothetical protein
MSATYRNIAGRERRPDDFYSTPPWCTRAILAHLQPGTVLDPCAGTGAVLDVVREEWGVPTLAIEVDAARKIPAAHVVARHNALGPEPWPRADLVVTNPPYRGALAFVRRALLECSGDCVFLLRLNFLASLGRAPFHHKHPCDVFVLPRRPSFVHGGTDATDYAWMVWGPGRGGRLIHLDLDDGAPTLQVSLAEGALVALATAKA